MYHKPGTLIECVWGDAWSGNSWRTKQEIDHSPIKVTTIGYVIRHDKIGLSLSATKDGNGTYCGVCFRPAKMIESTRIISPAKRARKKK